MRRRGPSSRPRVRLATVATLCAASFLALAPTVAAATMLDSSHLLGPAAPSDGGAPGSWGSNPDGGVLPPPPQKAPGGTDPGFADSVRNGFQDALVVAGLASAAVAGIGLAGFALVSRYISPKEALKNPQRAMLYGFVKGNPGVHLKRLSEEFHMKTSSILWHIRKLECAELVRSDRANGFRVFYPTEGGVEVRNVSRAVTALQNANAFALFGQLERTPGAGASPLADALGMHAGTARWHLKKLKEFGLVEEIPAADGARYLPTPLGRKAHASLSSAGSRPAPVPATPATA